VNSFIPKTAPEPADNQANSGGFAQKGMPSLIWGTIHSPVSSMILDMSAYRASVVSGPEKLGVHQCSFTA
jgi:hypothetical protein